MAKNNRRRNYKKGLWAELLASLYLRIKGYQIVEMRYKTPVGEIDILARKRNMLVAVEVKVRESFADALFAVTDKSQNRIARALEFYLTHHSRAGVTDFRFDVITIKMPFFIRHIDNAWQSRA